MARTRLILCACLLACVAVFFYSNCKLLSDISAKAYFISYHYTGHNQTLNKLKKKSPYKAAVKIKVRGIESEYSYALQPDVPYSFTACIGYSRVFTANVSFVYQYHDNLTSLRGPPVA